MGICLTKEDNDEVGDPSTEERNNLLIRIAQCLKEKDGDGKEKGMEGMMKEFNLEEEYESGFLRGGDMDWLLLALFNESDEVEPEKKLPLKSVIDTLVERKFGHEVDINPLVRLLLGRHVSLPEQGTIVTPFDKMQFLVNLLRSANGHREVKEADGSNMKFVGTEFENWGLTVKTNTIRTFVPKTKVGICNLVKWAKSKSLKVRAAGYRHSWSGITVNDGQVLISLLPLPKAENIPSYASDIDPDNELQGIELLDKFVEEEGIKKRLCKIGASTTNEQFRRWVINNSRDDQNDSWKPWWTLPLNVILVESTFGGSNAPICHGAGLKTKTLSDLVAAIEFVNAKGELQTVDDPVQLRSAAGCFGMLGIVTSLTMKLDPLTFAKMIPLKKKLALTIPPPVQFDVPDGVDMEGVTEETLAEAFEEFKERCENDYYVEYFWFPSQKECWINNWKNDGSAKDAVDYPSPKKARFAGTSSLLAEVANSKVWTKYPANYQLKVLTYFAMRALPERTSENPIVTPLIDALHFQRGIHNMRVRDTEWEIPIPGLKSDPSKPDWSVCQKAWWAVIKRFYDRYNKDPNDVPMRLALEMRITGGSSVNLAPQYGNTHGTCSIEILTPQNVNRKEWREFTQEITDLWTNLKDDDGEPIHPFKNDDGLLVHTRPHWAKEWEGLTVHGQPIKDYLRENACKEQIKLFRSGLADVAKSGGYAIEDADNMFSTDLSRDMFSTDILFD